MMKQLFYVIWLLSLLFTFSFAVVDERKTDIYFGNGVWNDEDQAELGREKLNGVIKREIIQNDPARLSKYGQVKLQYNWGKGKMLDVLETYYQLKEAGQVNHLEFFAAIAVLTKGNIQLSATATAALMASMPFVGNTEQNNVDKMYTKYYEESLQWSHRVLLVSHSQGNMFANRIYDTLTPTKYQDYFANVQVASPASSVHAKMGEHITNRGDMIINPIPGSMSGNSDPDLENRLDLSRQNICVNELMDGNFSNSQECLKYINHEFVPAYLGQSDPYRQILASIRNKLEILDDVPSQWQKSATIGCSCDQRIEVKHKFDDSLNASMEGLTVIPFDEDEKLYPIGFDYVKASAEGESITKHDSGDICMDLLNTEESKIDEFKGRTSAATANHGAVEVTLSWNNGADYDLELDMPGSVHDVQSCSMEHAYVYSEFEIYPGRYPVNVTQASTGNVSGVYYVSIVTPGESKVLKVDANETGHVADIIVKYVDNKPVLELRSIGGKVVFSGGGSGGGSSSSSSSYGGGHSYIPDVNSSECSPAKSCGCMPCEYWVVPYLAQAMTGPLSGADIALYHLEGFRTNSAMYNGKTSIGNTLYTAGLLNIPEETIAGLDDNALYIIAVSGGMDIDADDDMEVNDIPTPNLGTLHAILKGSELKAIKPKVNILTEVAYQIVKDDLVKATKTNEEIIATLDDIALHLLRVKIYSQSEGDLSHIDLLEWLPTLEKELLYASYPNRVVPIVRKFLLGNDIYQDAYDLVYHPDGMLPILQSKVFSVSEDSAVGTVIGTVPVQFEGNSSIVDMQLFGAGSDKFSIDTSGTIRLISPLDYETEQLFSLYVRAQNDDGFSKYTAIYIQVEDVIDAPYAVSFSAEHIYANASIGTKVGQIIYNVGSSAITSMQLTGSDAEYFQIDNNGNITTTKLLEDFFVKKAYLFEVTASNTSGESQPASITINVGDRRDIPQLSAFSASIDENSVSGTLVGAISVVSDGDSPIISYALSDTTQFVIDNNGTISVAPDADLDYEAQKQWNLSIIASNIIGDSRSQNVTISVNNIPDVLPTLQDINISINKETAIGTVIANVLQNRGDTPITSFTLTPDSPFSIDKNGSIRLESSLFDQSEEHFTLQAQATNSLGESESVNISITLIVVPVVSDFSATTFDNTSAGTVIGKVSIVGNGNPIETVVLSGDGSSDFHITSDGVLSVADGITLQADRQVNYQLTVKVNGEYGANIQVDVLDRIIGSLDTSGSASDIILCRDKSKAYITVGRSLKIIDINNSMAPFTVNTISTTDRALKAVCSTDGTKAYILVDSSYYGFSALQIIDINNSLSAATISTLRTPYPARSIAISSDNTKIYMTGIDNYHRDVDGLFIIDINDPEAPYLISNINTPGAAMDVTLTQDGTKAFVADGLSGIHIIDVSNPSSPNIVTSYTSIYADGVYLSDDETKIYASTDYIGYFRILDITDLNDPSPLGSLYILRQNDIAFSNDGTKAFVAGAKKDNEGNYESGVSIVDITDPTTPSTLSFIETPSDATSVALSADESNAYVSNYSGGLQVVNIDGINIPNKVPGIKGFTEIIEENSMVGDVVGYVKTYYTGIGGITSLRLSGEGSDDFTIDTNGVVTLQRELNYNSRSLYQLKAVATNSIGNREVDVTIRIHSVPELQNFTGEVNSMAEEGTYVGQIDMWVDDNTTITDIALIGEGSENFLLDANGKIHVNTGADFHHFVTPQYNLTAIATNHYGSSHEANIIVNILGITASIDTPGYALGVTLSADGTKAFVADDYSGLQIIDVSDLTVPSIIGTVDTPGGAYSVTLSSDGTKAFVADYYSGLQIIDISDMTASSIIGTADTPGRARGVTLSADGTKAFVADDSLGLQIIDVSEPTTSSKIGSVDTPGYALDVTLSADGTKAFVADGALDLQIIDVSDMTAPSIIGSVDTPSVAWGVTISTDGTKAFVADYASGLQIIDVSDPTAASIIGSVDTPGYANSVTLSADGTKAFVADRASGLQIIDVSDPTAPSIIGTVDTPGSAYGITLSSDGTKAFVADYSGLQIIDLIGLN